MEEILRRLEAAGGSGEGVQPYNLGRLYSEKEAQAALDEHIKMAEELGHIARKSVYIFRVKKQDCIGFIEICVDDMTTNQVLFDKRDRGMWRPYAGGGMLVRCDLSELTAQIREIYAGGPEAWAKDPSFRPYR